MDEVTCYTCNKPVDSEADTTHWSECGDYAWCQECVDAEVARAEAIPLAELANLVEHAAENQSVLDPYIAMRIAELLRELPQIQAREQALREALHKVLESEAMSVPNEFTGRGSHDCFACEEKHDLARAALTAAPAGAKAENHAE